MENTRKFIKTRGEMLDAWYSKLDKCIADYKGRPVAIMCTGAGASLGLIADIPGASKILYAFDYPYDPMATEYAVNSSRYVDYPAVSPEVAGMLYDAIYIDDEDIYLSYIAMTGALTTNRYRRGEDHAYICINDKMYHFAFTKITQEAWNELNEVDEVKNYRLAQDLLLCDWVMQMLVYGDFKKPLLDLGIDFVVAEIDE